MPFIRAGELTVHYALTGPSGAPAVVFANSLGTSLQIWESQTASLSGRYRVLRYDMRGHGLTDCPPVPVNGAGYTIDDLADDAAALLDSLAIGRVHFCGLSIGGMVGQRLAAKAPERVGTLILCATANRIGSPGTWDERIETVREEGMAGIAEGVLGRWFTDDFLARRADQARGYANMLVRTPAEGYIGCCLAIRGADLRRDGSAIGCPTLAICGGRDPMTTPEMMGDLAGRIDGARFETIADAAQIVCAERPAELTGLISRFLKENAVD